MRTAAQTLRSSGEVVLEREQQLAQLSAYREEYGRLLVATGRRGAQAKELKEIQIFLSRLEHAVEEITRQVDAARQRARRDERIWQRARTRLQALTNAVARHRARERQLGARGEQRQLDEHAARSAAVRPD